MTLFPVTSAAVYVTVVTPGGNDVPEVTSQVTLSESWELSVTSGGVQETRVSSPSRDANMCWSGGQPLTKRGTCVSGKWDREWGRVGIIIRKACQENTSKGKETALYNSMYTKANTERQRSRYQE